MTNGPGPRGLIVCISCLSVLIIIVSYDTGLASIRLLQHRVTDIADAMEPQQQQQPAGQPSGPPPPYPDDPPPPETWIRVTEPPVRITSVSSLFSTRECCCTTLTHPKPEPLVDKDFKICTHWHTLLASLIATEEPSRVTPSLDSKQATAGGSGDKTKQMTSRPQSSALHFWPPAGAASKSPLCVPSRMTEDELRYIQGLRDLGTFTFPLAGDSSPSAVHDYLTSLSVRPASFDPVDDEGNEDDSEDAIEIIGAQLALLPPSDTGLRVRMFAVSVLSDSPDGLFATGDAPAWKWAKPSTIYFRGTGHWTIDPADTVENASWMAGRDIMLLVRGFHEEHREWLATHQTARLLEKGEEPDENVAYSIGLTGVGDSESE